MGRPEGKRRESSPSLSEAFTWPPPPARPLWLAGYRERQRRGGKAVWGRGGGGGGGVKREKVGREEAGLNVEVSAVAAAPAPGRASRGTTTTGVCQGGLPPPGRRRPRTRRHRPPWGRRRRRRPRLPRRPPHPRPPQRPGGGTPPASTAQAGRPARRRARRRRRGRLCLAAARCHRLAGRSGWWLKRRPRSRACPGRAGRTGGSAGKRRNEGGRRGLSFVRPWSPLLSLSCTRPRSDLCALCAWETTYIQCCHRIASFQVLPGRVHQGAGPGDAGRVHRLRTGGHCFSCVRALAWPVKSATRVDGAASQGW